MNDSTVLVALADVHLGLRERGKDAHSDAPEIVAPFFAWLSNIPAAGVPIAVERNGEVVERPIFPPTELVLLGDILELWDGENATVLASASAVGPALREVRGKKVYVLGNHDNILAAQRGSYPIGDPGLEVVGEVYPKPDASSGDVRPTTIGGQSYLFVHGHQFDRSFQGVGRAWTLLGHLRTFGAATGGYAWLFVALTAVAVFAQVRSPIGLWGFLAIAGSVLLWFPRFYMTVARRIWARIAGSRYDRAAALRGFRRWWTRFRLRVHAQGPLSIVYGHTHLMDYLAPEAAEESLRTARPEEVRLRAHLAQLGSAPPTLFNISSWTKVKGPRAAVTWATLFYADAAGPLFLGWDWERRRPFHIPARLVAERWREGQVGPEEVRLLTSLEWPQKLIHRWATSRGEVE